MDIGVRSGLVASGLSAGTDDKLFGKMGERDESVKFVVPKERNTTASVHDRWRSGVVDCIAWLSI